MLYLGTFSGHVSALFCLLVFCRLTSAQTPEKGCLRLNGTCVEACPLGLYILEGECVPKCPQGFGVGTDNLTCQNCTLDADTGTCLQECPLNSYPGGDFHCLPCHPVCNGCLGPDVAQCLRCAYFTSNQTCVSKCPPNFMIYNQECVSICPNTTVHVLEGVQCLDKCPPSAPYELASEVLCVDDCAHFIFNGNCVESCPNSTVTIIGNKTCIPNCPKTHPFRLGTPTVCVTRCPKDTRYSLDGECVIVCPENMKFIPGERKCLDDCPKRQPLVFNQVCMRKCPPGTYRSFEETGFHCLLYVGLRGIAAVIVCLLVLLCVVFGICMSKQYNIVRQTEMGISSMVNESEKSKRHPCSGSFSPSKFGIKRRYCLIANFRNSVKNVVSRQNMYHRV